MKDLLVATSPRELIVLNLARDAGLLVVLDGRIGCTEYRSIHGPLDDRRFVHASELQWRDDM